MALVVTSKNAKKLEECKKPILILYRMNGCGHCEMFRPTWATVCTRLSKKHGSSLMVAEVEYGNMGALPKSLQDVMGFPTLRIIDNGRVMSEYNGMRTQEGVVEYIEEYIASKPPTPTPKKPPSAKPAKKASTSHSAPVKKKRKVEK